MAKNSAAVRGWPLMVLLLIILFTAIIFFIKAAYDSCNAHGYVQTESFNRLKPIPSLRFQESPLAFMKFKLVLLVSHELSLSGTLFLFGFLYWCQTLWVQLRWICRIIYFLWDSHNWVHYIFHYWLCYFITFRLQEIEKLKLFLCCSLKR